MPSHRTELTEPPAPSRPARSARWHSLDVLKGLALWGMIAHHFQEWTGGEVHGRFLGFERFAVTDLAPPLFALALGAGAAVVGARIDDFPGLARAAVRWGKILALGLALDVVLHGNLSGRGVLPTLALLGMLVTTAVAAGVRRPWMWWAIGVGGALLAVPATALSGDDPIRLLLNGPFNLPVYGVFAAAGAAVAVGSLGRDERELPLARATAGVLVVGLALGALARGAVASGGVWPPARYPGHLAFTLWALAASFAIWGAVRAGLTAHSALGRGAARAGRRTLVVFAAHFVVQLGLRAAGVLGELDSHRWGMAAWVVTILVCGATALPPLDQLHPRRGRPADPGAGGGVVRHRPYPSPHASQRSVRSQPVDVGGRPGRDL